MGTDNDSQNRILAAGNGFALGVKPDGTVNAAGEDNEGQVSGTSDWTDIVVVSCGWEHSVGLKSDGTVVACGYDYDGQVSGVAGWTDIIGISCGNVHTVGIKSDGTVVACGMDDFGQVSGVTGWTDIVDVACGWHHTIGLKSDGTVVGCGSDSSGQVSATQTWSDIIQLAAGRFHSLGLRDNGRVSYVGDTTEEDPFTCTGLWSNIASLSTFCPDHSLGLKTDGTVVACGEDYYGDPEPGTECVSEFSSDVKYIAAGWGTSFAKRDGGESLACGGSNYNDVISAVDGQWYADVDISVDAALSGLIPGRVLIVPLLVSASEVGSRSGTITWDANQIFITLGRSACRSPSPVPDFYLQAPGERSAYQTGPVTAEIAAPILTSRVASEGLLPTIPYVNIMSAPSAVRSLVVSPDVGYPIWATGAAVVAEAPVRNFVNRAPAGLLFSHGLAWWRWDASPALARTVYAVVLTGATSGEEDVVIPATVVSLRRRAGNRGALVEIETPPDADTAARIADRSSGEIVVYKGAKVGNRIQETEIIRAILEDVEILRGRKLRLSGRGQDGGAGRTVEIRPTYRLDEEKSRRYRAAIDPFLRPGDRVVAQGEVLTIEEMSYRIAVGDEEMEIEGK